MPAQLRGDHDGLSGEIDGVLEGVRDAGVGEADYRES